MLSCGPLQVRRLEVWNYGTISIVIVVNLIMEFGLDSFPIIILLLLIVLIIITIMIIIVRLIVILIMIMMEFASPRENHLSNCLIHVFLTSG